jgi:signal transduction histidine kinase
MRTPLTTVLLGCQLLEKQLDNMGRNNEETCVIVQDMRVSLEIALGLVNDMLTNDKLEDGLLTLDVSQIFIWPFVRTCFNLFYIQVCLIVCSSGLMVLLLSNMGIYLQATQKRIVLTLVDCNIPDIDKLCINGDEQKLGQAIRNLLSNALKFTPPGGMVSLNAVSLTSGTESRSEHGRATSDLHTGVKWLEIAVTDTGPGISKVTSSL